MLQLLPMQQIAAHRVAPGHITPNRRVWIVLKEKMPNAITVD